MQRLAMSCAKSFANGENRVLRRNDWRSINLIGCSHFGSHSTVTGHAPITSGEFPMVRIPGTASQRDNFLLQVFVLR